MTFTSYSLPDDLVADGIVRAGEGKRDWPSMTIGDYWSNSKT